MRARPLDVSKEVWDQWFEVLRRKTPEERLEMGRLMTLSWQREMFAAIRASHPDLPDEEIWRKLAARRLGRDVALKVYGRDIKP
ncbi:MAG TPA: hypothetical protein VF266_18510 [Thermoanaerobaculia bacterium]